MSSIELVDGGELVQQRSLGELADLINEALDDAERAGMDSYRRAGTLLHEACDAHFSGEAKKPFWDWVERNCPLIAGSPRQGRRYMDLIPEERRRRRLGKKPFESIAESDRSRGWKPKGETSPKRDYHQPVEEILKKVDTDFLAEERMKRAQELEEIRKLMRQIIDIGFRALASKLHPDKRGGSRHAMTLLNHAKDRLRRAI